jgi:1,2-diacylglycerol 3-beta-galactosyltransferase
MSDKQFTVLILTADAGFGHRAAANALKQALEDVHGDRCRVTISNPIDHPKTPKMLKDSQNDYDEIIKNLPDLYAMGYKASDATIPATLMEGGLIVLLYEALQDILAKHRPDLVITTYPTYQAPLDAINQLGKRRIPWITIITDLVTVHRLWLHPGARVCMVPTEAVKQRALKAGVDPKRIVQSSIPVNPRFQDLKAMDKHDLREDLGWDPNLTTLLVVGGTRVTTLMDALRVIDHSGFPLQMALVAGNDQDLRQTFESIDWHHPVRVYGFVETMPEFMRAADLIVCKAGGLIVTESLASGLPMMLTQALPGQEIGNAEFIVQHQAGALCREPLEVLQNLSHWLLNDAAGLKKAARNAARLGRADAARVIAHHAWSILKETPKPTNPIKNPEKTGLLKELLTQFKIPWRSEN